MPISLISKIKPQNNGAFPMYDDIDGYGGFQVRLNAADRNSIYTLNRKFGMLVYTQVENTFWQLESDLVTWVAILQSQVVPNASWNQATWFIDPVSGNNNHDGLTSGTAIKTWAELIRRWGTYSPVITLSVTITFLSDQPDTSDPVSLNPYLVGSGAMAITGTLQDVGDGYLAGVVNKNYNATGNYPNGLLQADLGGAASGHQGYLVVNHTQGGAVCWIDSLVGTVATLTQPFVSNVPAYNDTPAEMDIFTNGDAFSVFKPTKVYVENVNVAATGKAVINLSHLWLIDASGTPGATALSLSHLVRITETRVDCFVQYTDTYPVFSNSFINSWVGGNGVFAGCFIVGGSFGTLVQFSAGSDFSGLLDGDVIIRGANVIINASPFGFTENFAGAIYIDNSTAISGINETQITGDILFESTPALYDGYVYGKYTLNLRDVSCKVTITSKHGPPLTTNALRGTPTLQIDGSSFANAYDSSLDPGVWHPGRVLTVANLDTPISQGGFGGLAIGNGGAVFTNGQQAAAPINYQQQGTWFIDPQNGNDLHDGLTSITPIKTWSELVRRWGTVSPILAQDTTITFLSSQTDGSDPIIFTPFIRSGAEVQILGVLDITNQVSSGTISSTVARDRVTGQLYQTTLADTPSEGWLAHFTNNDSYSWVYKAPGGHVTTLSQPTFSSDYIFGGPGFPTDLSGQFIQAVILDGYSYVAYTPLQVNLVQVSSQPVADIGVGSGFNLVVRKLTGFDPPNPPPSFGTNSLQIGQFTSLFETTQNKFVQQDFDAASIFHNNWIQGGGVLNSGRVSGGIISGGINNFITLNDGVDLENDIILNNNATETLFATVNGPNATVGLTYVDGYVSLGTYSDVNTSGAPGYEGGTVVWGPGTLNVVTGFFNYTSPATHSFPIANLSINNKTLASTYDITSLTGVWRHDILLDTAHLDLSVSAGGFGGTAIIPGGGAITNSFNFQTSDDLTVFFVDPSNSTGLANDNNNGLTAITPVLTTSKLNSILAFKTLTNNLTVTYLSDDTTSTFLDLSNVRIAATGSLTFQGTPQVLHTGGTLNSGTIAINPTAPGGGQRQTAHTSDLSSFDGYVLASLGGTATQPAYLIMTSGPNTGTHAWIVSSVGATASMSRPVDTSFLAPGTLSIGDSYKIQRGSQLTVNGNIISSFQSGLITFNDFSFKSYGVNVLGSFGVFCNRCSVNNTIAFAGADYISCFLANDLDFGGIGYLLSSGVWLLTGGNTGDALIECQGDVYVRDTLSFAQAIYCNSNGNGNLTIFAGHGFTNSGIQLQDISHPTAALIIGSAPPLCTLQNGLGLIWGNGNDGYGIAIATNGLATVPATVGFIPNVTGALGDFCFLSQNGGTPVTVARAWDEAAGAYTEAGGPATRTTTWAHFEAPLGSNGFDFQAHNPATNGHIVGT